MSASACGLMETLPLAMRISKEVLSSKSGISFFPVGQISPERIRRSATARSVRWKFTLRISVFTPRCATGQGACGAGLAGVAAAGVADGAGFTVSVLLDWLDLDQAEMLAANNRTVTAGLRVIAHLARGLLRRGESQSSYLFESLTIPGIPEFTGVRRREAYGPK